MVVVTAISVSVPAGGETDERTNRVFHALADTTRRDILRRTGEATLSVSRLAERYPMSFAAVQKHVAVLERAGLVRKEKHGREQLVHGDPGGLRRAQQELHELEILWRGRVDRMSDLLAPDAGPTVTNPSKGH
ncbi:MAG: metalloregulator ArsR/SmtB family transcription factor [Actinomycetes bacterium]